mmetsp:Transcript_8347/g.13065  ORF Transcript_8347/g.13065 Transcript_8347/m.13065 type:complete len:442 (-) Transcript_8347:1396-2721(-)
MTLSSDTNDDIGTKYMDSNDNLKDDDSMGKSPALAKFSRKKAAKVSYSSAAGKFKKAPDAPRRFKSAFIFFSIEKHAEIRENLKNSGQKKTSLQTTNVAKMVSEAWKGLNKEEREVWEGMARRDRARYEVEVANYKGPWKVPAKRLKKPKGAPKKPTSAFLCFSNKRRVETMRSNPNLSQARISALLSKMWNEAPEEVRDTYIKQELFKRENYKKAIAAWRENEKLEKTKERAEREAEALAKVAELEVSASDSVSAMSAALNMHSAVASLQQNAPQLSVYFALQQQQQSQQQQQPSLSYAQDVARAAREHNTLQQLSNAHMRQQETLEKLMFANIASNLGYASAPSQSFASNLGLPQGLSQGLPPQLNLMGFGGSTIGDTSSLLNAQQQLQQQLELQQQLGMGSMTGLDPSSLINQQAISEGTPKGGVGTDWANFHFPTGD